VGLRLSHSMPLLEPHEEPKGPTRDTARPDSAVDLLITVPAPWCAGDLGSRFSSHQLPLDLLLYSESEVVERKRCRPVVDTSAVLAA
jgi:hypothetical protein